MGGLRGAHLQNLDSSAACIAIIAASHCMLDFREEGVALLGAVICPASLQQNSHRACQLLLHQVRVLACMPASSI